MKHVDIVAEIGINHNGSLETALELIKVAKDAGCDYVKFQKRDPDLCVPVEMRDVMRDTPWGRMSYIDYKHKIEFDFEEYNQIDAYCKELGIGWFMSVWDIPSLEFAGRYNPEIIKIPSALNEDLELIFRANELCERLVVSAGMADAHAVSHMMVVMGEATEAVLLHSVSCYPLEDKDAELSSMRQLDGNYPYVGYSDHTKGIHMAVAAVGMGANMIEKHITLDRTMWGTDQSASLEPEGLRKMVRNIRSVCAGWGDGSLRVRECEAETIRRLKG